MFTPAKGNLRANRITTVPFGTVPVSAPQPALQDSSLTPQQRLRYCNTLVVSLYRADQIDEAMGLLIPSLFAQSSDQQPFALYFLSMCYARRGDQATAHRMFHQAETLVRENDAQLNAKLRSELTQFAEESRLLLVPQALK